ncbi:MAG: hypothetical protein WA639_12105 [Candidatus Acidiferrum sp.]
MGLSAYLLGDLLPSGPAEPFDGPSYELPDFWLVISLNKKPMCAEHKQFALKPIFQPPERAHLHVERLFAIGSFWTDHCSD